MFVTNVHSVHRATQLLSSLPNRFLVWLSTRMGAENAQKTSAARRHSSQEMEVNSLVEDEEYWG